MRILFVSQYFPPEMGAPSARTDELSREWCRQGHSVTVLTAFAHHPVGKKAPGDRYRLTRREKRGAVDVLRAYVWASANRGTFRRAISYATFSVAAVVVGLLRAPRVDVVVATSPQLLAACSGYALSRIRRKPFVFEVRDLWPESILAVEAMKQGLWVKALRWLSAYLYRNSDKIVTVGDGYRAQIARRYPVSEDKIEVIANGIDTEFFVPAPRQNAVRREYGWQDRFVILYLGTHGMAHALHVVIEVAARFEGDAEKLFVFVGEGAEKETLKASATGLSNVCFIDQQPKDRVREFYAACDVGVVTLRDAPLFQDVLPSKIFEYLGMERPILLGVGGHARRLVEQARAGLYVAPEQPEALYQAVEWAHRHPEELQEMGRAGRKHVVRHFDRRRQAARYVDLLQAVAFGEDTGQRRPAHGRPSEKP